MPPADGGAPWRPFCGVGRCLPLVSSLVPLTPFALLIALRRLGHVAPCQELSNGNSALLWKYHCLTGVPFALDARRGGAIRAQVSDPGCLLAAQSLWATEWRSQVVTGPVRGAANGAAFIVGARADRRSSAPSVLPFFVVCVGLVCSVGCPWGCSNSLMLRRCGII
eukprot:SAG25_NODE_300_length_10170_cov_17.968325_4_plen_166_part_00